jgi:hypothetical protein
MAELSEQTAVERHSFICLKRPIFARNAQLLFAMAQRLD